MTSTAPQNNAGTPAKKSRKPTAEGLRAGTSMTREAALANLSQEERQTFEAFLAGDQDAMTAVKASPVAGALFNAQLHARADKLAIEEVIKKTVPSEEDEEMAQQAAAAGMTMPAMPDLATSADVIDAVQAWQSVYGPMRGEFKNDVFACANRNLSKPALLALMDLDLINPSSGREIQMRFEGKQYATPKDHDVIFESYLVAMLKKGDVAVIETLVEHAQGIAMLKHAQEKLRAYAPESVVSDEDKSLLLWVYRTQDLLFDEQQVDTLDRFLTYCGSANISMPDDHARPHRKWMSFLAYKVVEEDIPTLEMLVNKHNLQLNVYDQYGGTPYLRAASTGNLPLIKFLQSNPPIDVLAEERMGADHCKTALDYAMEGPARRAKEQDYTARQNEENQATYEDTTLPAWEKACEAALAAGEEPPEQPQPPKAEEIPPDYPLELISIVQDAFANADPTLFKKEDDGEVAKFSALDDIKSDDAGSIDLCDF